MSATARSSPGGLGTAASSTNRSSTSGGTGADPMAQDERVATIDLNADVGEGMPVDEALLGVVTSANVACGFHAGDEETMRRLCRLAVTRGVAVGAHVGYRDREGLGRRPLDVPPETIEAETAEQISTLQRCAAVEGTFVRYV